MFSSHRVYPLWKISPVLAAALGIVAVGLHLLGVLPGPSAAGPAAPTAAQAAGQPGPTDDPARAVAEWTQVLCREPNNVAAYVGRGNASLTLKKPDQALADYEQALRLAPDNADAHLGRGLVRLQRDEDDLALADFNEVIRLAPQTTVVYVARGDIHRERKEYPEALADFDRALELDPESFDAFIGRGKARRDQKDYERAVADFQEATRINPDSPEGYNELAWLWATCPRRDVRNPDLALEYAARACKMAEWKDSLYLDTYAAACAACGEFGKAVRWQKKAIDDPEGVSKTVLDEMRTRLKLYLARKAYVLH
jgi:Tfp pilus assembly protein PilF